MKHQYISDYIDLSLLDKKKFNIIASGTGTGKTWYFANEFRREMPHIRPHEILFIESRSLIVDQQVKTDGISKYDMYDPIFIKHWNGQEDSTEILERRGIQTMTYDKIINIIVEKNVEGLETLGRVKVIILDECHTLFSDTFIKDMEALKVWVREVVFRGGKIFIGLTATPSIIEYHQNSWGVITNRLNKDVLINYKAKQLHCTDFDTIPYIVTTQLEGKTMIMCYTYNDCKKLKNKIPNSFILISKYHKGFTSEMNDVRQYIVDHESLPETFVDVDGVERDLNVLITTSTLREGVNLRENSNVKNIVCCFSDELHITQFVGRARYSINNLVIADTYINTDNIHRNSYLAKCRMSYRDYLKHRDNTSWFDSIHKLVEHDIYEVKIFMLGRDEKRFISYINSKWLVPQGKLSRDELNKYKIYKNEHKDEIVKKAIACRLLKLYPSKITFNKIINLMRDGLGYTVESKQGMIDRKRHTYKLVVDFDEELITIDRDSEQIR